MAESELTAEQERTRADSRHLIRAGLIVSSLGIVAKVVGLLREAASAAVFGATRVMDSFQVANSITQMFATWIEMPMRSAIIPFFTQVRQERGEQEAWRAASNIINTLALFLLLVVGVLVLGSDLLVRLFATGFEDRPGAWGQSARLVNILAASLLFSVLSVILGSLQNLYRRQLLPALGRLVNGTLVLAGVAVLGPRLGIEGYALGILAGAIGALVLQLDILWRFRRYYRLSVRPFAPEVRRVVTIALPLFIGLTGTRIDVLIDRNFASHLPAGHLAVLAYALIASAVVTDLVLMVSQAVLLPHFAHLAAERRYEELRARLAQALRGYLFLMLPVTAFLCGGAPAVVDFLYVHAGGRFDASAAALTALVLPVLALAAPVYGSSQMIAQVYISAGDTKTPMIVGFWRVGVKTALSLALFFPFGLIGLATASTASAYFRGGLLWRRLPRELRPATSPLLRDVARQLVAAAVAGGVAWLALELLPAMPWGPLGEALRLVLAAGATLVTFLVLAWLTGEVTVRELPRRLLRRR